MFEWDSSKALSNIRKHGVRFADAVMVFEDDQGLTISDDSVGERRWVTLGMDAVGQVLVVVYTWRGDRIRIISARRATPREQKQYLEQR
ncbi:MAG TPA: BrnT family toxin [Bryobacteraceae bacterium]|nr:BrnT family toxin [Bryobacteraceae bacterium]HPT25280.1 BrnT family toxin [Bryobacteraceae bacterium]